MMPEETPEIPQPTPQPPRARRPASRFSRIYLEAELGEVGKEVQEVVTPAGEKSKETTRFPDLTFEHLNYPIPPESRSSDQEIQDFKVFDRIILELLDLTREPIALFGSHALYRLGRGSVEIPGDSDIATTPAGALELYEALQKRTDVKLAKPPYLHDPNGPLKALRFDGKIQISRGGKPEEHPFEVFGEGGEYQGEKLLGLFRLGDPEVKKKSVITQKLIRAGFILDSYNRLIDEMKAKHPDRHLIMEKWERRIKKIQALKKEFEKDRSFQSP